MQFVFPRDTKFEDTLNKKYGEIVERIKNIERQIEEEVDIPIEKKQYLISRTEFYLKFATAILECQKLHLLNEISK